MRRALSVTRSGWIRDQLLDEHGTEAVTCRRYGQDDSRTPIQARAAHARAEGRLPCEDPAGGAVTVTLATKQLSTSVEIALSPTMPHASWVLSMKQIPIGQ